jgi:YD repeat-containing protein
MKTMTGSARPLAKVAVLSRTIAALVLSVACVSLSGAQSKTTRYTYDVLGRLTFVEDSQNGNRDYDYDHAGNRTSVAIGTANDAANEALPPSSPAKPTGLFKNYIADCAWRSQWTLVDGATYYSFKNTAGQTTNIYPRNSTGGTAVQISGSTIVVTTSCPQGNPQANEPGSLKACGAGGCSDAASF